MLCHDRMYPHKHKHMKATGYARSLTMTTLYVWVLNQSRRFWSSLHLAASTKGVKLQPEKPPSPELRSKRRVRTAGRHRPRPRQRSSSYHSLTQPPLVTSSHTEFKSTSLYLAGSDIGGIWLCVGESKNRSAHVVESVHGHAHGAELCTTNLSLRTWQHAQNRCHVTTFKWHTLLFIHTSSATHLLPAMTRWEY